MAGLLPRPAREGDYIHGVHPAALVAAVRDDPGLGRRLLGPEAAPLGRRRLHARHYLVRAMTCRFDSGPDDP